MTSNKLFKFKKFTKGFTLMEMLIVVTIIGILAAIILPRFVVSTQSAKASANSAEIQAINTQLELFYFTNGSYPETMDYDGWGAEDSLDYWPDGVPTSDVYGAPLNYDNTLGRVL